MGLDSGCEMLLTALTNGETRPPANAVSGASRMWGSAGALILGLLAFFTRGRRILITDTDAGRL